MDLNHQFGVNCCEADRWQARRRRLSRRGFLELAVAAAGSALLPSFEGRAPTKATRGTLGPAIDKPNVILVIVDAWRSDHVPANGYARPTTPNLDAWIAGQGVTFLDATSPSSWTFPATAAILTGRSPSSLGANFHNTILPDDATTLAQYLQAAGYYTAGFVAAGFAGAGRGFARGFHVFDDAASRHPTSQQNVAAELNGYVIDWLDAWTPDARPLFLLLYYIDPHTWYHPPAPYDTLYDPDYTGPFTPDIYRDGQDVVAGVRIPNERDVEHLKALYDGETAYWDAQLGLLLSALDDRHLLDNAILILTSDHGQAFGEHGKWIHANCLYEEVLRVPLIMRYPGVISPGRLVDVPVQNMDLMPTILDWVGIPIPPELQAVSLRPLAEGLTATLPRDIFSEMAGVVDPDHWAHWIAPRSDLRSVQRGPWKFIHHVGSPDADELYRLNPSSIYETENLILSEPELARELRTSIFEWFSLYQANLPYIAR